MSLRGGSTVSGRAGYFLGPDTYWSNESVNGWLSRLGINSTWTRAPFPGMPVEAFLRTEERTMLSYLLKPLGDQARRAFREK